MNKIAKRFETLWLRAGVAVSARWMNTGTDKDRIEGAVFALAAAVGAFALSVFHTSQAWAVTDLNGAASNLQSGFQSAGRMLYYGAGAGGIVTAAGGILHARTSHLKQDKHGVTSGLAAAGAGAALTGIGTYMAFFNQSTMQDTGGMSTNAMGIPQ